MQHATPGRPVIHGRANSVPAAISALQIPIPPPRVYIVIPITVSGVATPENKSITHWRCHSYARKKAQGAEVRLTSGSWKDAVYSSCDSPNISRRFALGASNVCLVGDNPTCSVPT